MHTATEKSSVLRERLARICPLITTDQANTLRRAEQVLHRWSEGECGDGNDYCSWSIERDEVTGKPYRHTYPSVGKPSRILIADKEAGALKRIAKLCKELDLYYYHQGDCRGCSLYVSSEPLTDTNYSNGIACC